MPPVDDEDEGQPVVLDDVRSALNAAIEASEAETVDEKPAVEEETAGRVRGPDGKFAKADEAPVETAPLKTEEAPAAPEAAKPAEPPVHWSAPDKEAFAELTPKAQAAWLRRDQEMTAGYTRATQEIAAFKRDYEPVAQILQPYEAQMRGKGFTPVSLVKAWSDVEIGLADPARNTALVGEIIKTYKIDPAALARTLGLQLATQAAGEQPPPSGLSPIQLPPELASQIETLEQRSRRSEEYLAEQERQRFASEHGRVMNTITAFRDAVDDKGQPKHPHYDELEADMVNLLNAARASGREPSLDQLYETAVWANTSTRTKMLADQSAAEQAQRVAADKAAKDEARAKAERAKRAASPITGAPAPGQNRNAARNGDSSVREALLAAMEDADA